MAPVMGDAEVGVIVLHGGHYDKSATIRRPTW